MIRIVTCIDFDTDDPREAYRQWRQLWNAVDALPAAKGIEAESTEEWFDDDGEPLDEGFIAAIRMDQLEAEGAEEATP